MGTWNYLWHTIFLFYLCAEATTTLGEGTSETATTTQNVTKGPTSRAPDSSSGTTAATSNATFLSFVSHSSAPSPTPGVTSIGSGATTSQTLTPSPVLTVTSPKPLNPAASTSPDSGTTQTSLVPTVAGSVTAPAVLLTSRPLMQGQTTAKVAATSSSTGNPLTVTSLVSTASHATSSPSNDGSLITKQATGATAEPHAQTSLSLLSTSLVIPSTMGIADGQSRTETAATTLSPEGSSLTVSVRSKVTSLTSTPDTTATDVSTASGTDASLTLSSNLPVMNNSSSPPSSSDATSVLQQSSTSGTTEASSDVTSHTSVELISSAPSRTPAITSIGSGAMTSQTMTMTSPKPLNSAASTSPDSGTTQTSLVPTVAGSVTTPSVLLTSGPLTQGQAAEEEAATSSSTGNPLTAAPMASAASHATTPPTEDKSPITKQGTVMTTEPNAKTSLSLPATSLVIPSTTRMADGQGRTETVATPPALEHSSLGVSARSEATSLTLSTIRSNTTTTASGSAASQSFSPGLPVTTHASSTPAGSSAPTRSLLQGSTSGITEGGLDATSHTSTAVASSATSSTPGTGSGAVTAETMTSSPAPSSLSVKPSVSTAETQTAPLTSRPFTQGQVTVEAGNTSSSTGTLLPAVSTASAASRATTPPDEGKSAITDQGSSTTAEPKASTSLSSAATSLVTEFTTDFRKPTSVNPSLTCSPVSIEVQNVTGEAIQLSWTGGRRDSLYTISLISHQEINITNTKETKMIFEHLLPSRVYKISVAASSCEDSLTSVSVRTDSVSCFRTIEFCSPHNTGCDDFKSLVCSYNQAFACSVLLKKQTFNHTLYNSDSEEYKAMIKSIKTEVVGDMRMKLNDDHFDIIVLGFKPGSVIAAFISVLQTQEPVDVVVIQTQLNEVLKSKFGDQADVTVQSFSIQSSNSSWKVAVIVLGVLLGVALVLLLLVTSVCIYMKKRSGKYVAESKGILGNFAYKHM